MVLSSKVQWAKPRERGSPRLKRTPSCDTNAKIRSGLLMYSNPLNARCACASQKDVSRALYCKRNHLPLTCVPKMDFCQGSAEAFGSGEGLRQGLQCQNALFGLVVLQGSWATFSTFGGILLI